MASGPALVYWDLVFPLNRLQSTIGRQNLQSGIVPTVDLTALDRDRVVSRRHAEIAYREGELYLVDVEARNGVMVNGQRMAGASERHLRDGDSISFGGVALSFRREAAWPEALHAEWERVTDHLGFDELPEDVTTIGQETFTGQLLESLERRQMLLNYQPKVVLATGKMEAVECLIRWKHPLRGLVPPDEFLPLAENTGYIKAITAWVLETALTQCAAWHAMGLHVHVAVNISTRDLENDRLPLRVEGLLRSIGVSPEDLIIEVTETGVMTNPRRALENLCALKATHVTLSIDDFGIGQSSLAYLKELPADELKIDKAFSRAPDAHNLAILRSAINVGHDLGMRVVAEGIEDAATVAMLRQLGCDGGQGYFFGRPMPADALAASPLARGVAAPVRSPEGPSRQP
jgi:EAL domain-containing protein (putative c-di-GMP-specific phosphodiesterase class I)